MFLELFLLLLNGNCRRQSLPIAYRARYFECFYGHAALWRVDCFCFCGILLWLYEGFLFVFIGSKSKTRVFGGCLSFIRQSWN